MYVDISVDICHIPVFFETGGTRRHGPHEHQETAITYVLIVFG